MPGMPGNLILTLVGVLRCAQDFIPNPLHNGTRPFLTALLKQKSETTRISVKMLQV